MTPGELREVLITMKEFGVSRIRMGDLDVSMGGFSRIESPPSSPQVPVEAPTQVSDPVQHKVEQLTSLMKLSDNELVDQLFPDHTGDTEESV